MADVQFLLWLDMETTCPVPETTHVVEVAAVLTTLDPEVVLGEVNVLVTPTPETFVRIEDNPVVHQMHTDSGLLGELVEAFADQRDSVLIEDAEDAILDLLAQHCPTHDDRVIPGIVSLAGSGIAGFDAIIVRRLMPRLAAVLPYHVHDVGPLRRGYVRATGEHLHGGEDPKPHRALADAHQHRREGATFHRFFRDRGSQADTRPLLIAVLELLAQASIERVKRLCDGSLSTYTTTVPAHALTTLLREAENLRPGLLDAYLSARREAV